MLGGNSELSVGFTYFLQQRRGAVLASNSAPVHYPPISRIYLQAIVANEGNVGRKMNTDTPQSMSGGFTYFLQDRWRAV